MSNVRRMTGQPVHVIARAVIQCDAHVLIARCKGAKNTFLPGGHVRYGEQMSDTIIRELREEFGESSSVVAYIGAIEHSFTDNIATQHEINHFFEVELSNVRDLSPLPSLEDHLEFFWHPISQLTEVNLQPDALIEFIQSGRQKPLWASTLRALST
jgi:8-oxo-dGTP diphosphatase